jgi:hypothetical protein
MNTIPAPVEALVLLLMVGGLAAFCALFGAGIVIMFRLWQNHNRSNPEEDDDEGGGWGRGYDPPSGSPPSGPEGDPWMEEFHRELDLIGRTIEIEETEKV